MPSKTNIKELRSYLSSGPKENRTKKEQIIQLYQDKKIVNYKTALNSIMLLSSRNKHTINSGRPQKEYEKIVSKYGTALSMTGRLERERQQEEFRTFSATILLFKDAEPGDADVKVDVPSGSKQDLNQGDQGDIKATKIQRIASILYRIL